jgi:isopenicillin N synthase-like dioxygenase
MSTSAAALLPGIEPVSMSGYTRDFAAFSDQLGASFRRYGFAVIADHGLDQQVIDAAIERTKAFFALPDEVKRRYHQPGGGGAGATRRSGSRPPKAARMST